MQAASYPTSEVRDSGREYQTAWHRYGREELPHVRGQGGQLRGDTQCPRSGVETRGVTTCPSQGGGQEELPHAPKHKARGCSQEELPHEPMPEARGGGQEEIPHVPKS